MTIFQRKNHTCRVELRSLRREASNLIDVEVELSAGTEFLFEIEMCPRLKSLEEVYGKKRVL